MERNVQPICKNSFDEQKIGRMFFRKSLFNWTKWGGWKLRKKGRICLKWTKIVDIWLFSRWGWKAVVGGWSGHNGAHAWGQNITIITVIITTIVINTSIAVIVISISIIAKSWAEFDWFSNDLLLRIFHWQFTWLCTIENIYPSRSTPPTSIGW